jgi:ATP-binding cassette subfamily B protein
MTIVVAGHRLEALRQADHMIVLDQGQIVEQGDPETLLASPDLYRSLAEEPEEEQKTNVITMPALADRV